MLAKATSWAARAPAFLVMCFALVAFGAAQQQAAAQSDPVAFAQKLGDDAIADLTNPSLSDGERVKRMRLLLQNSFDEEAVSKFVLGRYVKRASDEQFQEFIKLYEVYVAHNYAGLFKRYNGEKVEMKSARDAGDGNQIVSGVIRQPEGPPIILELRLRPASDDFKVVDLKVEGVSMPLTHRKQFASVISQRGGKIEGLLVALRGAIDKFEKSTPSR